MQEDQLSVTNYSNSFLPLKQSKYSMQLQLSRKSFKHCEAIAADTKQSPEPETIAITDDRKRNQQLTTQASSGQRDTD